MPIGCTSLIPFIAQDLFRRRPASVLDLGCGNGLYGAIVRNYCGDLEPGAKRQTQLIGVEGFEAYRNPTWELYDCVATCTIDEFFEFNSSQFELILLMDVIEHFNKPRGMELIGECMQRLTPGGILWVGTPGVWQVQGAVFGNDLEIHRCLWTVDELRAAGLEILLDGSRDVHGNQMLLGKMIRS